MRHVNRSGAVKLRLVMPCRAAKRVHPGDTECTFSSWDFEHACSLFNVGAALSYLATHTDRGNDDGIKRACHLYQQAAG